MLLKKGNKKYTSFFMIKHKRNVSLKIILKKPAEVQVLDKKLHLTFFIYSKYLILINIIFIYYQKNIFLWKQNPLIQITMAMRQSIFLKYCLFMQVNIFKRHKFLSISDCSPKNIKTVAWKKYAMLCNIHWLHWRI